MTADVRWLGYRGRQNSQDVARAVGALPPLPAIALKVLEVAQDVKSSAADLATVVSADPGLSATVLRVANSPAYRRSREVSSVREALVLLGFVQARNIAIGSAIAGNYRPDYLQALFRIDAFWRHSLAVAFRAGEIASRVDVDVPSAFTAGVVHNMGRLAMFHADPAGMDQTVAEAMRRDSSLEELEDELLGVDHTEVGRLLARRWRLPAEIRDAVSEHHSPHGGLTTLGRIVAEADRYCVTHGLLPGYVVPGKRRHAGEDPELDQLLGQVDALMDLVSGAAAHFS